MRERDDLQQRDDEGDEGAGDDGAEAEGERGVFVDEEDVGDEVPRGRDRSAKNARCVHVIPVWMNCHSCCRGCKSSSQLLLQARRVFFIFVGPPAKRWSHCLVPRTFGVAVQRTTG